MAYMDYMDLAVPRKAVKFNQSLTHCEIALRRMPQKHPDD